MMRSNRRGTNPRFMSTAGGGHGFGMRKQGTSSDHWVDAFYNWLEAKGMTK